jgi:putative transposase
VPRSVNELCLLLGYSRQSYYQGTKLHQRKAYEADLVLAEVNRHRRLQKRLGTRKLLHEMDGFLNDHGFKMGRDALFDLLREYGLLVRRRKRSGPRTTFSRHRFRRYPNIIRGFIPSGPNQLWVSDITYIRLYSGFAYLSIITDAYSRKIVGYCLRKDLSATGPLTALRMALENNPHREGLIHHSDRGIQYCCDDYISLLTENRILISMTESGDPLENPIAERVNGILKQELLEEQFPNLKAASGRIALACSVYNDLRPHGSIDNRKPSEMHLKYGPVRRRWKSYYRRKEATMT